MLKKILQNSKSLSIRIRTTPTVKSRSITSLQRYYSADSKDELQSQVTSPSTIPPSHRVIIIGAGLSGLSAANHLIKNGVKDVLILEAAERYGGRIHTKKFGDAVCELGSKWINANDTPNSMFRLAKEGGLLERTSFDNSPESFFIINKESMDDELVQLGSMMFHDIIKSTEKYMTEDVPADRRTADTYLKARMIKVLERMPKTDAQVTHEVFKTLMRNLSCQLGSDLGYIHVKHLANIARHLNNPVYIPSGLDQVFKQLVKNIPNEQLLLGKPVSKIRWADLEPNEKPQVTCMDGSKYYANQIICTIPLGALNVFSEHLFSPNLPENKRNAINKLGRGAPGKIYLNYKEPVNSWFIGSVMLGSSQLESTSRENWIAGISEIATPPGSRNVIEIKVGGTHNEIAERISEDIVDHDLTSALRKLMKNNKIPHPKDIIRSTWSTDARTLCGLPYISIQSSETSINDLGAPLGQKDSSSKPILLFAGDATIFDGFGTMEAARNSGIREAVRILEAK